MGGGNAAAAARDDVGAVLALSLTTPATSSPTSTLSLSTIAENHIVYWGWDKEEECSLEIEGNDQPLACAASHLPHHSKSAATIGSAAEMSWFGGTDSE